MDGLIEGDAVGAKEGRFSGHDWVYEGEDTTIFERGGKVVDHFVVFTD